MRGAKNMKPDDSRQDSPDAIQQWSLVAILDQERNPPVDSGVVIKRLPHTCLVQTGPCKEDTHLISMDKLFLIVHTDGKKTNPEEIIPSPLREVITELVVSVRLSKELRELRMLKERARRLDRKITHRIRRGLAVLIGKIR